MIRHNGQARIHVVPPDYTSGRRVKANVATPACIERQIRSHEPGGTAYRELVADVARMVAHGFTMHPIMAHAGMGSREVAALCRANDIPVPRIIQSGSSKARAKLRRAAREHGKRSRGAQ